MSLAEILSFQEDFELVIEATAATSVAVSLWFRVFVKVAIAAWTLFSDLIRVSMPIINLLALKVWSLVELATPHVVDFANYSWEKTKEVDPLFFIGVALGLTTLGGIVWLYKYLKRKGIFTKIRETLRKSKGQLWSLFILSQMLLTIYYFPETSEDISKNWHLFFLFSVLIPLIFTIRALDMPTYVLSIDENLLIDMDPSYFDSHPSVTRPADIYFDEKAMNLRQKRVKWLDYWIAYAFILLIERLSFINWMLDWIPYYHLIKFYLILWMTVTDGAVLFRSITLDRFFTEVVVPDNFRGFVSFLHFVPFVRSRGWIIDFINNSLMDITNFTIVLVAMILTPTSVITMLTLLVTLVVPIYSSLRRSTALVRRSLCYWICFHVFDTILSSNFMDKFTIIIGWWHIIFVLYILLQMPALKIHHLIVLHASRFVIEFSFSDTLEYINNHIRAVAAVRPPPHHIAAPDLSRVPAPASAPEVEPRYVVERASLDLNDEEPHGVRHRHPHGPDDVPVE